MDEGQQTQTQLLSSDKWYTPLIRPTPLSKYLALALFVVLPFVGFWLGNVTKWESYSDDIATSEYDTQAFDNESADQTAKEVYKANVSEQVIVISKSDGTPVKEIAPRDVPPQSTGASKGGPDTLDNPERTYVFLPLNDKQESIIDSSRGRVYFRVTNTENTGPMSLKDMLYVYDITSGAISLVIPPVFQLNILATGIAPDLRYVAYTEYHSVTVYDLVTARQVTSIDEPDTLGDDTGMQVKIKGWSDLSTLEYEIYHITPIVNTGYKKLVSEDSVFTLSDTKRIDVTTLNIYNIYNSLESSENRNSTPVATSTLISTTASNIPKGWNSLQDAEQGYEIGYPSDYVATSTIRDGTTVDGSWTIYQDVQLPQDLHAPKTVYVEMINPNTIYQNHLDGSYTEYDPETGFCYTYSVFDKEDRAYQTETLNGYVVCSYLVGDAGHFSSSIVFIYPDKIHALKISTGGDQYQQSAPVHDFAKTVRLLGPQPNIQVLPSHLHRQFRG